MKVLNFSNFNELIPNELLSTFNNVGISLYRAEINQKNFLSCFIVEVSSETLLNDTWFKFINLLGVSYQSGLDDFSRWNIYVLFMVEGQVSDHLKYKIENNKVYVRKMVEHSLYLKENIIDKEKFIDNHILGKDIKVIKPNSKKGNDCILSSVAKDLISGEVDTKKGLNGSLSRMAWFQETLNKVKNCEI